MIVVSETLPRHRIIHSSFWIKLESNPQIVSFDVNPEGTDNIYRFVNNVGDKAEFLHWMKNRPAQMYSITYNLPDPESHYEPNMGV